MKKVKVLSFWDGEKYKEAYRVAKKDLIPEIYDYIETYKWFIEEPELFRESIFDDILIYFEKEGKMEEFDFEIHNKSDLKKSKVIFIYDSHSDRISVNDWKFFDEKITKDRKIKEQDYEEWIKKQKEI